MATILVIEDDDLHALYLKKALEGSDYSVMLAVDGNEGLRQYKLHGADLIITDLIMPEKEGIETIQELVRLDPRVPIIAISGGGGNQPDIYLEIASKLGARRTFAKPYSTKALLAAVQELILQK